MRFRDQMTGRLVETAPWQDALQVGAYYLIENPNLWAGADFSPALPQGFGKIISDEACERRWLQHGFFWAEAYSQVCPEGEVGLFCIAEATRQLTEDQFRAALATLEL